MPSNVLVLSFELNDDPLKFKSNSATVDILEGKVVPMVETRDDISLFNNLFRPSNKPSLFLVKMSTSLDASSPNPVTRTNLRLPVSTIPSVDQTSHQPSLHATTSLGAQKLFHPM